jgi:ComF family protein
VGFRGFLVDPILDFVFPRVCGACGNDCSGALLLCPDCRGRLRTVGRTDSDFLQAVSRLQEGGVIDTCTAVWYFEKDGPLQSLLHLLKYSGRLSLGRTLGEELGRRVSLGENLPDLLIPVPLHPTKLRERGYNQSSALSAGVQRLTGIPVAEHVVRRNRYTSSQTHLSLEERAANVDGAFSIAPGRSGEIEGMRILLLDDVLTTGATLRACASVIKRAGAVAVDAGIVALARSPGEFSAIP